MNQKYPRFPRNQNAAFSLTQIFPHIILIAVLVGVYYYIWRNNLFYNYLDQIYVAIKVIIVVDIFIASINSALIPILSLMAGVIYIHYNQDLCFSIHSIGWALILMAIVGFILRLLINRS